MCFLFTLRSLSPGPVTPNLHIFVPPPTPSSWILLDAFLTPADVFFRLPVLTLARCWYTLSEMSHIWLWKTQGIGVPNQALWNTGIDLLNPYNPELNPICYLLALLGAHHFLQVSRIRVKSLTLGLLMSYIYGAPILDVSRSHTTTQHSR